MTDYYIQKTEGPWVVDSKGGNWIIRHVDRPKSGKVIGRIWSPGSQSNVNYRERAIEEADIRNLAIIAKKAK